MTAAQVRGVRLLARKADQTQWERPANPVVGLTFTSTRRENLLWSPDGTNVTPVPSDRPDLPPAPGETARGTFTDDVQVHGDGAWLNQADPWVADATETAQTRLVHLRNAISVSKAPGNGANQPPGFDPDASIPYVMKFQNTGTWPQTGLKLSDQIATNAKGSLLVWPLDDGGDRTPSYSFTLTSSAGVSKAHHRHSAASLNTTTGLLQVTAAGGVRPRDRRHPHPEREPGLPAPAGAGHDRGEPGQGRQRPDVRHLHEHLEQPAQRQPEQREHLLGVHHGRAQRALTDPSRQGGAEASAPGYPAPAPATPTTTTSAPFNRGSPTPPSCESPNGEQRLSSATPACPSSVPVAPSDGSSA